MLADKSNLQNSILNDSIFLCIMCEEKKYGREHAKCKQQLHLEGGKMGGFIFFYLTKSLNFSTLNILVA